MNLTDKDKLEIKNILLALKKAKFDDFTGLEALAFARAFWFLNDLLVVREHSTPEKEDTPKQMPIPIEPDSPLMSITEEPIKDKPKRVRKK